MLHSLVGICLHRMNAVTSFCCHIILDVHYDIITSEMMIILGDGWSTMDEPWQNRGGPTVAKYDRC